MSANRPRPSEPDGTTDWEVLFEDEKKGLIPLIAQVQAPDALRHSVTTLIQGLFIRKDDSSGIERFTAELDAILASNAHPADMGAVHDRVTKLLRRIKENRKQTGAHPTRKKVANGSERRRAVTERRPVFSSRARMSVLGIVALCGAGFLIVWSNLGDDVPTYTRLVEEMEFAANGGALSFHAFGGALKVEASGESITVTAESVPQSVCVSAAWKLAPTGRVAINGAMPRQLVATQLAELCGRRKTGATITWYPAN